MQTNRYLGDGVYADFDGYQIKLSTGGNIIYLDMHVQKALMEYIIDMNTPCAPEEELPCQSEN